MDANVGEVDSHLRLGMGLLALLIGVLGFAGMLQMASMPFTPVIDSAIFIVIGLFLTSTGYLRKCPVYSVIGRNTA